MGSSIVGSLTFVSVSVLVLSAGSLIYDCFLRYRIAVQARLKGLASEGEQALSLFKDITHLRGEDVNKPATWQERLQRLTEQAGLSCSLSAILMLSGCLGVSLCFLGVFIAWWLGGCLFVVGCSLPFIVLFVRRNARTKKLARQLPEVFQMISRTVRSGQTVSAALKIIADDFDAPVSEEFTLCYEQQNLGMSRETALRKLVNRTGIMELHIFVVALFVQAKSGGDLVELLDNLADMVRKRLRFRDRVRGLTGEGRMQAWILLVLPLAAFFGMFVLAPEYAAPLLERPRLLSLTIAAQIAGAVWIRRIVNFEY